MLPPSLLEILKKTTAYLEKAGVENPRLDAEWMLAAALNCGRLELYLQFDRPMEPELLDRLRPMVARRAKREPLQFILGEMEFAGVMLKVDPRALIPRPETEDLVARWIERALVEGEPSSFLDLGTGTGAIALALAKAFPLARAVAVERSPEALSLARENAERNNLTERVSFREGSWFDPVQDERFDLIISNPPYLSKTEWEEARAEVRDHEPYGALVADDDGLADLKVLLAEAGQHLEPGGCLVLETGIGQHSVLAELAAASGFVRWESWPDDSHRDRGFLAWFS